MMAIELYEHQIEAIGKMKNGCILVGDVGSGKSRTALVYYYIYVCGGSMKINGSGAYQPMKMPRDLYIITTAKKRDSLEWEEELSSFDTRNANVVIDSWNNIKKYVKVYGAFFIFDEQRVVGYGAWAKAFLNIARKNKWILLSATPGDTWLDYAPVFIANGFYKNITDFKATHCIYSRFAKYPKVEGYMHQGILVKHRNDILVTMEFERSTVRHNIKIPVEYDRTLYRTVWRDRWDPYDNEPIAETGKLFYLLRKVVNSDPSRLEAVKRLCDDHKKVIVFYNYSYELYLLRNLFEDLEFEIGEWNGEVHSEVPDGEKWAYLVQYMAGCEGWNCITTDTIIFYSQSYSYRQTKQAEGRIDRINTPYTDLYYYKLRSTSQIDVAIYKALSQKRNFNEKAFLRNC